MVDCSIAGCKQLRNMECGLRIVNGYYDGDGLGTQQIDLEMSIKWVMICRWSTLKDIYVSNKPETSGIIIRTGAQTEDLTFYPSQPNKMFVSGTLNEGAGYYTYTAIGIKGSIEIEEEL